MKQYFDHKKDRLVVEWCYEDWKSGTMKHRLEPTGPVLQYSTTNEKELSYISLLPKKEYDKILERLRQSFEQKAQSYAVHLKEAHLTDEKASENQVQYRSGEILRYKAFLFPNKLTEREFTQWKNDEWYLSVAHNDREVKRALNGLNSGLLETILLGDNRTEYNHSVIAQAYMIHYEFLIGETKPSTQEYLHYEEASIYIELTGEKIRDPRSDSLKIANDLAQTLCNKTAPTSGEQLYVIHKRELRDGIERYVNSKISTDSKRSIQNLRKRFKNIVKLYPETEELVRPHLDKIEGRLSSM